MTLSIKDCVRFGWETFKKRPWLLAATLAIGMVIEATTSFIEEATGPAGILSAVGILIALLISVLYAVGHTHLFLKVHDNPKAAEFKDLWHPKPFWRFLTTSILLWLVIGIPFLILTLLQVPEIVLVLLAIPALVIALVFGFALYLVVDKDMGSIESLKESARLTHGHRKQLFLLILAIVGINIVGLVALFIGLFVTIPVTVLAMVHAYRTLAGDLSLAVEPAEAA